MAGVAIVNAVNPGDTTLSLNKVDGLAAGQHIRIGDGPDVYTIVNIIAPNSAIDVAPGVRADVVIGAALAFSPPVFASFGAVRGTFTVDVTLTTALDASYDTIKLIGNLSADTTITVPPEDGWSARFLDLTIRNGYALRLNVATSPGMADYDLANGKTQRLFIEYDPSVPAYNVRAEGPPA